jgi:Putative transposase
MLANQRKLYPLLFDCAAQSLLEFGRNRLKGDLGITAVLHSWGQKLNFHPHLHCIVTGGALSPDGKRWRSPKQRLFPVRALAALFRGKFLAGLRQMLATGELSIRKLFANLGG